MFRFGELTKFDLYLSQDEGSRGVHSPLDGHLLVVPPCVDSDEDGDNNGDEDG